MSGLKRKEEEIGLVELDAEKEDDGRKERSASKRAKDQKTKAERMALAAMIAGGLLLIFLGTIVFQIPLITVGCVVVIEAVIASALNNSPFWLHIAIMTLQVIMGFFLKQILFLILAAAYYFLLLLSVKLLEVDG